MYQIRTLGSLSISRNGDELQRLLNQKHGVALLVYLSLEGATHRDSLLTLFWADKEEEKARHSLSQMIYDLRRQLGEECLSVAGERVAVENGCFDVDALRLLTAVEQERWSDAVALFDGGFLPGFYLKAAGFESWLETQRARVGRLGDRAHSEWIRQLCANGEVTEALAVARRWVGWSPLNDEAQRYFIELLAIAGQPTEALRQFERYARALEREFDLEPTDETLALVERVRSGQVAPAAPEPAAAATSARSGDTPLSEWIAKEALPQPLSGHLLRRVRQQRIVQILLLYAGYAWLSLDVTDLFSNNLGLPRIVFVLVLLLVLAGLPTTVLLAWSQAREPAPSKGELGQRSALLERALRPWHRLRSRVKSGHVIVGLALVSVALLPIRNTLEPRESASASTIVLVLPFEVDGEPAPPHRSAYLKYQLERVSSLVRVLDGGELPLGDASSRDGWKDAAERSKADYVVAGHVWVSGDSMQVVTEVSRSNGVRLEPVPPLAGAIFEDRWLMDRAVIAVYELLATEEGWPMIEPGSPERSSPGAWPLLSGMELFRRSQFGEAIEEFRRAIEADSTLARAYLHLSLAQYWYHHDPVGARKDSAVVALAGALQRRERLSIRGLLLARAFEAYLQGNVAGAIERYGRAVERYPDDSEAWLGLADSYQHLGPYAGRRPEDARVAWERLLQVDSLFTPAYYHLVDLAFLADDRAAARDYLDGFLELSTDDPENTRRGTLKALSALTYGSRRERDQTLADLPSDFWEIIKDLVRGGRRLALADSVAIAMTAPGRAPAEHQRGHEYRFVILTAMGRHEEAAEQWRAAVRAGENASFNPWVVMSYLAGHPTDSLALPMLRAAENRLADPGWPDPALDVVDPEKKAFRGLVQYAALRGDSGLVRKLQERLTSLTGEGFDAALVPGYQAALDARLALLAHDTAAAVSAMERSLERYVEPLSAYLPTTVLAPQRLMLAELLAARGDREGALRWLDSFEWTYAIGDVFFLERVRRLRARLGGVPPEQPGGR